MIVKQLVPSKLTLRNKVHCSHELHIKVKDEIIINKDLKWPLIKNRKAANIKFFLLHSSHIKSLQKKSRKSGKKSQNLGGSSGIMRNICWGIQICDFYSNKFAETPRSKWFILTSFKNDQGGPWN